MEGAAAARVAQKRRSRALHGEILASYQLRSVGGRASSLQAAWADPRRAMPGGTGGALHLSLNPKVLTLTLPSPQPNPDRRVRVAFALRAAAWLRRRGGGEDSD